MSDAYERIMRRTIEGPTVRPELGPCLDCTYKQNGLGYVQVRSNRRMTVASRIVLEHKLGRKLGYKMYALHHCDRRHCVQEDHLYEGTYADNANDRWLRNRGSYLRGEAHGMSKLTVALVWDIRELIRIGDTITEVAKQYHLPRNTVRNVVIGRTWSHLGDRPLSPVLD